LTEEIKKRRPAIENARKGGLKISQNREHMATIGRRGGLITSQNKEHMSAIGKLGQAVKKRKKLRE
jgi:general stress protein YciG